MKRQKRDLSQRAFVKGYQVGFNGRPKSGCPHQVDTGVHSEWMRGWEEGRTDQRAGFSQFMGQQKVANF